MMLKFSFIFHSFISLSGRRGGPINRPRHGLLDRHRQLRHEHVGVACRATARQHHRRHRHDHTGYVPHSQAVVRLQLEPSSRLQDVFSGIETHPPAPPISSIQPPEGRREWRRSTRCRTCGTALTTLPLWWWWGFLSAC